MNATKKRVSLNRRSSSLLLDYNALLMQDEEKQQLQPPQPSDYTRQLIASALSLPSSVQIETKASTQLPPSPPSSISTKNGADKIDLPQFRLKSSLKNPKCASAPCSPTIGLKSVRFHATNLEDVCLFRKAQTPLAISQKNIFWADNRADEDSDSSSSSSCSSDEDEHPIKNSIKCSNWPTRLADIIDRKNKIIRVDKNTIRLQDDDFIIGKVSVRNLSYHKTVTIRHSFDYWKTVDNVEATYLEGFQKSDIFTFKIHVPSNAATLYFAVNYKVGSEDYWDNNDGRNYQVEFITSKPNNAGKKSSKSLALSNLTKSTTAASSSLSIASQNALKSRYDFSQAPHSIPSPTTLAAQTQTQTSSSASQLTNKQTFAMPIPIRRAVSSSPTGLSCHSPLASSPSFMDLNSQSYMELVNKYCFYSTSPSRSPMSING